MKKFVWTLLFIMGVMTSAMAQTKNFVISTGNPKHIPIIIKSANDLAKEYKDNLGKIEIVLYGKAVNHLDRAKTSQPWFDQVQSDAIKFKACGIALNKRQIDKKLLPKKFDIVSNALIYILKLKDKGYIDFDF